MGNGASIDKRKSIEIAVSQCSYEKLESLCRSGYFLTNEEDFRMALERAIQVDSLDVVELFVAMSNIYKFCPMHIAASFGKLESLELLVSAGFKTSSRNNEGQLPLHLCSTNRSQESYLCANWLLFNDLKSINCQDDEGMTPLHLAVARNNDLICRILLEQGAKSDLVDRKGRTPLEIALRGNKYQVIDLLRNFVRSSKIQSKKSSQKGKKSKSTKKESQKDIERIMLVWEKFFENAFKAYEAREQQLNGGVNVPSKTANSSVMLRSESKTNVEAKSNYNPFDFWDINDDTFDVKQMQNIKSSTVLSKPSTTWMSKNGSYCYDEYVDESLNDYVDPWEMFYPATREWFNWILSYSQEDQAYFVYHRENGESYWLSEFMEWFEYYYADIVPYFSPSLNEYDEDAFQWYSWAPQAMLHNWMLAHYQQDDLYYFLHIYSGEEVWDFPSAEVFYAAPFR